MINGLGSEDVVRSGILLADDWILDAALRPWSSDTTDFQQVALVTAHNALALLTTTASQDGIKTNVHNVAPGSNCILYAAQITWLSSSQCLVASGTAFGDVVVWSCSPEFESSNMTASFQVHYTFSAHEGSVFGVQLSPPLNLPSLDDKRLLLASCSDDRMVKVWDITDRQRQAPALTQTQRDTGFGGKEQLESHAPPCLAKAMGHLSRVWSVRFISYENANSAHSPESVGEDVVRIRSFGEDASVVDWLLKRKPQTGETASYTLEQSARTDAHAGKHIWSTAVNASQCLVTGGADGAIAVAELSQRLFSGNNHRSTVSQLPELNEDSYRVYAFTGEGRLVVTTNAGSIIPLAMNKDGSWEGEEAIEVLNDLKGYSAVAVTGSTAFVSGTRGEVHALNTGRLSTVTSIASKTAGLFTAGGDHDSGTAQPLEHLLITAVGSAEARLITLEQCETSDKPKSAVEKVLPLPPGDSVTAFEVASTAPGSAPVFFLGFRAGAILTFAGEQVVAVTMPSVHGKEAVTSLLWRSGTATAGGDVSGYLLSIGRDGTLAVHAVSDVDGEVSSKLMHQTSLPFGPNLEGLRFMENDHLLVWGFRSKHFVSYDVTAQRDIFTVECGGAHRNHAYQPSMTGGTFIWTKASKLYSLTQRELPHCLIGGRAHGREVKATAVSPPGEGRKQLIATGSEDTDIRIFTYAEQLGHAYGNTELRCLQTLRRHNTGIQHLQWKRQSSGELLLFSSGGFEEFFVWRGQTGVPGINIGFICESKHPRSGTSDLRIMGFDAEAMGAQDYEIYMAYSDSTLKKWLYAGHEWKLLASGDYLTACLTEAVALPDSHRDIITTATDGHLTRWRSNNPSDLTWHQRFKIHQNAILSIGMEDIATDLRLIVTGGDDNAIGLTLLEHDNATLGGKSSTLTPRSRTLLIPSAHAAAITAVVLIPSKSSTTKTLHLVSASIDQRVKAWRIDVDVERAREAGVEGLAVECLRDRPTPVADVSSLDLVELADEPGVVVCGVGMDVLSLGLNVVEA